MSNTDSSGAIPRISMLMATPCRSDVTKPRPARAGRGIEKPRRSERNVVVRTVGEIRRDRVVRRNRGRHVVGTIRARAQHLDVARHDLGGEALLSLLILPLAGADAAFDEDLPTLGEVLADDLGLLAPDHHPMPLGGFLLLTALVGPALGGGDAQIGDRLLARGVAQLRVGTQIADQDDLVHAAHVRLLSFRWGPRRGGPEWTQHSAAPRPDGDKKRQASRARLTLDCRSFWREIHLALRARSALAHFFQAVAASLTLHGSWRAAPRLRHGERRHSRRADRRAQRLSQRFRAREEGRALPRLLHRVERHRLQLPGASDLDGSLPLDAPAQHPGRWTQRLESRLRLGAFDRAARWPLLDV